VEFVGGRVRAGGNSRPLLDAVAAGELVARDAMEYGDLAKRFAQQTFGAHFVEVAVDAATGKSASGACWACSPPAASSIRWRRAARSSAA
jgi:CO/xanthine dehydrogenase Mo-binding subunit